MYAYTVAESMPTAQRVGFVERFNADFAHNEMSHIFDVGLEGL